MIVVALARYATVAPFGELPLFCFIFPRESVVTRLDCHGLILFTILVFLPSHLTETHVLTERDFQYLFLEFLVTHQLLQDDHVPVCEYCSLIFLNVGPAEGLDEREIIAVESVLNFRH